MKINNQQAKDALNVAEDFADEVRETGQDVVAEGEKAVRAAGNAADQRWKTFVSHAKQRTDASKKRISRSPLSSIAIALGVGVLVGAILKNRD